MILPRCRVCGRDGQEAPTLDLGPQPISNRFKAAADSPEFRRPLRVAQCPACALVQLAECFPSGELRPREAWMRYREREDHLPACVDHFQPMLSGRRGGQMLGVTGFDTVLGKLLSEATGVDYAQLSAGADLGITHETFGMETLQRALTPAAAREIAARRGHCDVFITRYLLEHAADPLAFLSALRLLLVEDGFVLVEVPEATGALTRHDYAVVWEEHASFFTESTLAAALGASGFAPRGVFRAPSKFEPPLLLLAQKTAGFTAAPPAKLDELERFRSFVDDFPKQKEAWRRFCESARARGKSPVLFGAGHFAVAFASYFGLDPWLDFVVDDDPHKAGRILAGTRLPIVTSAALAGAGETVVILCVNPDVEERLMARLKSSSLPLKDCYSIFAESPRFGLHESATST